MRCTNLKAHQNKVYLIRMSHQEIEINNGNHLLSNLIFNRTIEVLNSKDDTNMKR